jgi:tRNA pseudouridine38/39 synthase
VNANGALNIKAMQKAASYFLGENDFRNFCKMDPQRQITVFKRTMTRAEIVPYGTVPGNLDTKVWVFELQGTAFLWHQVRCMMAILFLVGQGLEDPEIVRDLLDVEKYPTKPEYVPAYDIPLVLYNCHYDGLDWRYDESAAITEEKLLQECYATWHEAKLRELISGLVLNQVRPSAAEGANGARQLGVGIGNGVPISAKKYRNLEKRPRQLAFDIVNEKYLKSERYERKRRKLEAVDMVDPSEEVDKNQGAMID